MTMEPTSTATQEEADVAFGFLDGSTLTIYGHHLGRENNNPIEGRITADGGRLILSRGAREDAEVILCTIPLTYEDRRLSGKARNVPGIATRFEVKSSSDRLISWGSARELLGQQDILWEGTETKISLCVR